MDNDSFYPAFVTAARVLGLGNYAVGLLEAKGINLKENALEEFGNQIVWTNETEGKAATQVIYGFRALVGSTSHFLRLAVRRGSGNDTFLDLINSTIEGEAGQKAKKFTLNVGGIVGKILLDGVGQSSFVQAGGALARRETVYGYQEGTFPGATSISNTVKIVHGLNAIPNNVQLTGAAPSPGDLVVPFVTNSEKGFVEFFFQTKSLGSPAAGTKFGFFYEISV